MSLIKAFNFECCVSFLFILTWKPDMKTKTIPLLRRSNMFIVAIGRSTPLRESTPNARKAFGGCGMWVHFT